MPAQLRFASVIGAAMACEAPAAGASSRRPGERAAGREPGSAIAMRVDVVPGGEEPDDGIEMTRPVESSATGTLTRGLELLRLLNEAYPLQIRDLHTLTGLPKPTISRLLATLRVAGYVQRDGAAGYRPSSKVHVLSAGVSSLAWISDVAAPVIDRLSQAIHWPSDFAVFEGRGMTIRYTTRPTAPISISDPINTAGLPMLESDFGRAFLAFASSEQQARILAALARSERKLDAAARDAESTRRLLDSIRRQGFATRGESFTFTRAATIAVAVTVAGQSVGAVNVICSTRFMDPADIPRRYLEPLRQAAAEIGRALSWDGFVVTVRRRGA